MIGTELRDVRAGLARSRGAVRDCRRRMWELSQILAPTSPTASNVHDMISFTVFLSLAIDGALWR